MDAIEALNIWAEKVAQRDSRIAALEAQLAAANEAVRVLGESRDSLARQAEELGKRAWALMIHHNGGSFDVDDGDNSEWATLTKSFIRQTEVVGQMTDEILVVRSGRGHFPAITDAAKAREG